MPLPAPQEAIGKLGVDVHEDGLQLGWEGDEGFGDLLLERLLAGSVTVLFEPVALLDPGEAAAMRASGGQILTVFDLDEEPVCNVRVVEVFETTWGDPDPRLVAGDGYGTDRDAWRRANEPALQQALATAAEGLSPDTSLLVQRVEVIDRADR